MSKNIKSEAGPSNREYRFFKAGPSQDPTKNEKITIYRDEVKKDFQPISGNFDNFIFGANSLTGWRISQEDRFTCTPLPEIPNISYFFGIYDGHGGEEVAEYLKRRLHEYVRDTLLENEDIETGLNEAFLACDRSLRLIPKDEFETLTETKAIPVHPGEESKGEAKNALLNEIRKEFYKYILEEQSKVKKPCASAAKTGPREIDEITGLPVTRGVKICNDDTDPPEVALVCGSTATAVVFGSDKIYVANVGDSRCIAIVNGEMKILTRDHRPFQRCELDRIIRAGHSISRGRVEGLNMSRAFGDFALKDQKNLSQLQQAVTAEPSIFVIDNDINLDFVIIASDGIWNALTMREVADFVMQNNTTSLTRVCSKLFDKILNGTEDSDGQDNLTMIIIKNTKKEFQRKKKNRSKIGKSLTKKKLRCR